MLRELFDKHQCDKGKKHSYDLFYQKEFEKDRLNSFNILEIGIFKGASAKSWIEYFPNCIFYCIDITINDEVKNFIDHPRIKYLEFDSTDRNITEKIKNIWNIEFDIVIEDGLHTPEANQKTFENIFPLLKKNGRYYIEDFFPIHLMSIQDFESKSGKWAKKNKNWDIQKVQNFLNFISQYNFDTFDNRYRSNEQDSFIIKVTK